VARERPINAPDAPSRPPKPSNGQKGRRRPRVALALKLVGGAVVLAVVFIVAAILGSGGGHSVDRVAPISGIPQEQQGQG